MAGMIQTSQATAVLAFAAAMGKARGALLSLLQRQASGPVANMADAGALAVRTLAVDFRHLSRPPLEGLPISGIRGRRKNSDFPGQDAG